MLETNRLLQQIASLQQENQELKSRIVNDEKKIRVEVGKLKADFAVLTDVFAQKMSHNKKAKSTDCFAHAGLSSTMIDASTQCDLLSQRTVVDLAVESNDIPTLTKEVDKLLAKLAVLRASTSLRRASPSAKSGNVEKEQSPKVQQRVIRIVQASPPSVTSPTRKSTW